MVDFSRIPRPRISDLILASCSLALLTCVLIWQYAAFAAGSFGYHDLTIISDFFSNALMHAKPFWVTNAAATHLATHFTPTLLLLVPAFTLFQSQFAVIAVVAVCVCLAIFVAAREQLSALERTEIALPYRWILVSSFFVTFALNRFTMRILSSAHFEPVFLLTASMMFAAVSRGLRLRWLLVLLFLALGVRQDAGFFLFFALLSCLVAPRAWGDVQRVPLLIAAVGCVLYVAFASKVIMPWYGNDGGTRFWASWGATWPEVFLAWARDPKRVLKAIELSEFSALNAELSYVHTLNPLAWLANQLPAILFYTADSEDKRRLWFYNASFVLPGLMLCLAFAQLHLASWTMRFVRSARWRTASLALVCCLFVVVAFRAASGKGRGGHEQISLSVQARHDPFVKSPLRELLECEQVRGVAADFRSIVYIPFKLDKYLQQNAAKAEVVLVAKHPPEQPFLIKPKRLVRDLTKGNGYRLAGRVDDFDILLAPHVECGR